MSADPYEIAGAIRRALVDIRDHYDAALIPPQRAIIRPTPERTDSQNIKAATHTYEHSPAPANIDVLAARIASRPLPPDSRAITRPLQVSESIPCRLENALNSASYRAICAVSSVGA